MADFESFASFNPSFSLMEMESGLELMNQFPELNTSVIESPSLAMMCYSNQSLLSQQPPHQYQPPTSYVDNFPVFLSSECSNLLLAPSPPTASIEGKKEGNNKRRAVIATPDCASGSYSTPPSENGLGDEVKTTRRNSSMKGKRKRGKCNAKQVEKPKEVIHVRARRGQATDSHSLAERVRREKINERMRCLQDLVPGCYKAMGMAVMLDEIIDYVQSLQNQVEFLSMKLSAASSFYDFNMDMDAVEMPQVHPRVDKGYEGQEVDSVMREGYAGCTSFHSILPF